jgi:membrane protein YdbS with pleckstrin-like domain
MDAIPFFVALLMDAAVIVWRWDESINYFVLVAISVTALLFLVGKLYIIIKDSNTGENDENPELL